MDYASLSTIFRMVKIRSAVRTFSNWNRSSRSSDSIGAFLWSGFNCNWCFPGVLVHFPDSILDFHSTGNMMRIGYTHFGRIQTYRKSVPIFALLHCLSASLRLVYNFSFCSPLSLWLLSSLSDYHTEAEQKVLHQVKPTALCTGAFFPLAHSPIVLVVFHVKLIPWRIMWWKG